MSGYNDYNFPAFHKAERYFHAICGYDVVNPAKLNSCTDKSWEYYLRTDLVGMLGCNHIALLTGWEFSKGATLEALVAAMLNFTFFEESSRPEQVDHKGSEVLKFDHVSKEDILKKLDTSLLIGASLSNKPAAAEPEDEPSILLEAQSLVHGDRQNSYGHPYYDYDRVARLWSVVLDTEVTPEQAVLCMICIKISRECHKHKRDNLVDMAGYSEVLNLIKTFPGGDTR